MHASIGMVDIAGTEKGNRGLKVVNTWEKSTSAKYESMKGVCRGMNVGRSSVWARNISQTWEETFGRWLLALKTAAKRSNHDRTDSLLCLSTMRLSQTIIRESSVNMWEERAILRVEAWIRNNEKARTRGYFFCIFLHIPFVSQHIYKHWLRNKNLRRCYIEFEVIIICMLCNIFTANPTKREQDHCYSFWAKFEARFIKD